jgi:hypothetical protein
MRSLLVDPFQRKVHVVDPGEHIADWHKYCDCLCFDHVCLGEHFGQVQDLWVDDEGLLKNEPYPMWVWENITEPGLVKHTPKLCGYGLINASIGPETIATKMEPEYALNKIRWEPWEERLDPKNYFDQLSRLYFFGTGKSEIWEK